MSRIHSDDSSLELLLDTMCNTFGGVMFIAILLSVMVSIRGQESNDSVPEPESKIEEVKQQVAELQKQLSDITESTIRQAEQLKNMETDPRMKLVYEVAMMEQMYKEKTVRRKLIEQKRNLNRSTLKNLEIQTLKVIEEEEKSAKVLKEQTAQMKEKSDKLQELVRKTNDLDLRNMYFMTMVQKEEIPYFLFVNKGMLWPIGPEINGNSYKPNKAVSFQTKSQCFVCTPVPGSGIPLFSGEALSAELQQFLKQLPADRVAEFVISKSDAADFDRLREILKKQNYFHGFRVQTSDQDYFEYQFVSQEGGTYAY